MRSEVRGEAARSIFIKAHSLGSCYLGEGAGVLSECMCWVGVVRVSVCGGGGQAGVRVILLICESCQRPLVGESSSGGVANSDSTHAEGGSGLSLGCVGGS